MAEVRHLRHQQRRFPRGPLPRTNDYEVDTKVLGGVVVLPV